VLRLPPSNFQQAAQIVNALGDTFGTKPCRLVIVKDTDAAASDYSKNMDSEFRAVLGADKRTRCAVQNLDVIDFDETSVQTKLEEKLPTAPAVNAILFFGMTNRAAQLLQALNNAETKLPKTKPVVVVSDGSTTSKLIDIANKNSLCVWGAFPFGEPRGFESNMPDSYKHLPSFFAYGYDAYLIALQAMGDAGKDLSRETVAQQFKRLAIEKRPISGMAGVYEFDSEGGLRFFLDNANPRLVLGQYHLWQVREDHGKLVWSHRKWREGLDVGCESR
jgi:ABC-type branched-subunit amino acid transport system substrate-binding protein